MPPTENRDQPSALGGIRSWLRSDMRVLRWVFLGLYLAIIAGFLLLILDAAAESLIAALIMLGINLAAQALFIFGSGTINLCYPLTRRRLLLPAVVAGFMMAVLFAGIILGMTELFRVQEALSNIVWFFLAGAWVFWGWLMYVYARNWSRYRVMSRLASVVFAGSLAELLATVPSHMIVIRRPGCLVGLFTMLGIIAGVNVMFFTFGPGIVLLFLRPRLRRESAESPPRCQTCGYDLRASKDRCPECGTPFGTEAYPIK